MQSLYDDRERRSRLGYTSPTSSPTPQTTHSSHQPRSHQQPLTSGEVHQAPEGSHQLPGGLTPLSENPPAGAADGRLLDGRGSGKSAQDSSAPANFTNLAPFHWTLPGESASRRGATMAWDSNDVDPQLSHQLSLGRPRTGDEQQQQQQDSGAASGSSSGSNQGRSRVSNRVNAEYLDVPPAMELAVLSSRSPTEEDGDALRHVH